MHNCARRTAQPLVCLLNKPSRWNLVKSFLTGVGWPGLPTPHCAMAAVRGVPDRTLRGGGDADRRGPLKALRPGQSLILRFERLTAAGGSFYRRGSKGGRDNVPMGPFCAGSDKRCSINHASSFGPSACSTGQTEFSKASGRLRSGHGGARRCRASRRRCARSVACRATRSRASEQVLVTAGTGCPTSGLIRGAHRATWASRGFTLRMGWMTISRTAQTP